MRTPSRHRLGPLFGAGAQLVTGAQAQAEMQALRGNRMPGVGAQVLPRGAGDGPPASVGLVDAPFGVGQLPGQVLAGPFPASSLAIPQTADLTFLNQPFLPTVRQYVAVGRGQAEGPDGGAGGRLLAPQPTIHPTFWNVTVWAKELIRGPGEPPPSKSQLAGNIGCQSSYYKIRVQWNEYPSRLREILLDAGTAFDIAVGPTTNLFVDLMAPNPDSSDARPAEFDDFRADVYVVASAWGTSVPIGHATGRFTQSVYFPPVDPPSSICVRVADGARRLQLLEPEPATITAARWSVVDVDASPLRTLGNINISTAPGESGTDIVEIPQYAKAVCLEAGSNILGTVVQELEL